MCSKAAIISFMRSWAAIMIGTCGCAPPGPGALPPPLPPTHHLPHTWNKKQGYDRRCGALTSRSYYVTSHTARHVTYRTRTASFDRTHHTRRFLDRADPWEPPW